MNCTPRQALAVYTKLIEAYMGTANYGSTTAEIYAYLIQQYDPRYLNWKQNGSKENSVYYDDCLKFEIGTMNTLMDIIEEFKENFRDCTVHLEDHERELITNELRNTPFGHRIHITVKRKAV